MKHTYTTVPREDRAVGWDPLAYSLARVKAGMTFRVMSQRLGVSISALHKWSGTGVPPSDMVAKIAKTLNCRQKDLLK